MPKQRKASTKIEYDLNFHVKVRVKSTSNYSLASLEKLNITYNHALNRIYAAQMKLEELIKELFESSSITNIDLKKFEPIFQLLKRFFDVGPKMNFGDLLQAVSTIRSNLVFIYEGLRAEFIPLYIAESSKKTRRKEYGYVHKEFLPDTIFLDFDLFNKSSHSIEDLAVMLIHEASHLFVYTEDYDTYFHNMEFNKSFLASPLSQPIKRPCLDHKLTGEQKLNHADTYAYFVNELSNYVRKKSTASIDFDKTLPKRSFSLSSYSGKLFDVNKPVNDSTVLSSTPSANLSTSKVTL